MNCDICGVEYVGENEAKVIKAHKEFWHNPWLTNRIIDAIDESEKEVKSE